tara:strand:- start:981 stop:1955 length:975 start_codon:yes stop_codon:yes gene_type:complete
MRRHWANSRGIRIPPTRTASGGGPAIVPPDAISGLALWTDPSDLATVNARGSGTANTYPLVTLDDKASGVGGRVGGPSNPSAAPPFFSSQYWSCFNGPTATTINGRTAMLFNGSNQYGVLRTIVNGTTSQRMHNQTPGVGADGLVINSESVTVIAVVDPVGGKWPASGAYNTYDLPGMFDLSAGYGPGAYIYGTAAAGNKGMRIYKFTYPGSGDHYVNDGTLQGFVAGGPTMMVWRQQDPGPSPGASYLYGGVSLNLTANPLQTTTSQIYRSYLTKWKTSAMYLGFGYNTYASCKIGEFCVWDRALSDAEIQSLQPYFNQQWGL